MANGFAGIFKVYDELYKLEQFFYIGYVTVDKWSQITTILQLSSFLDASFDKYKYLRFEHQGEKLFNLVVN